MLSTPPAFILSQDRTLKKRNFESQFGSNYFNKNSILRIEKGPFYFKFCILFNFQDPRFSFDFRAHISSAFVKVLDYSNSASLLCQGLFSSFEDFFSIYLKVNSNLSINVHFPGSGSSLIEFEGGHEGIPSNSPSNSPSN